MIIVKHVQVMVKINVLHVKMDINLQMGDVYKNNVMKHVLIVKLNLLMKKNKNVLHVKIQINYYKMIKEIVLINVQMDIMKKTNIVRIVILLV